MIDSYEYFLELDVLQGACHSLQTCGSPKVITSTTILRNVVENQLGKAGMPHPENQYLAFLPQFCGRLIVYNLRCSNLAPCPRTGLGNFFLSYQKNIFIFPPRAGTVSCLLIGLVIKNLSKNRFVKLAASYFYIDERSN